MSAHCDLCAPYVPISALQADLLQLHRATHQLLRRNDDEGSAS